MKKKIIISFTLMAALTLSVAALMIGCGTDTDSKPPQTEQTTTAETLGVAYPTLMTYEEYKKLSPQLQQAYYETFPTPELYMQWFNAAVQAYNQMVDSTEAPEDDNIGQVTKPAGVKDTSKNPEIPTTIPNNTTLPNSTTSREETEGENESQADGQSGSGLTGMASQGDVDF